MHALSSVFSRDGDTTSNMSSRELAADMAAQCRVKAAHLVTGPFDDIGEGPRCDLASPQRAFISDGAPAALSRHHQRCQWPDGSVGRQRPPRVRPVACDVACAAAATRLHIAMQAVVQHHLYSTLIYVVVPAPRSLSTTGRNCEVLHQWRVPCRVGYTRNQKGVSRGASADPGPRRSAPRPPVPRRRPDAQSGWAPPAAAPPPWRDHRRRGWWRPRPPPPPRPR